MIDLKERLREVTYSHDCWGSSERCYPPAIQIEAAEEIVRLERELAYYRAMAIHLRAMFPPILSDISF